MLNRSPGTVRHERQVRPVRRLHRRFRQVQMRAQAFRHHYRPVAAHLIPTRRCNLACAYCNEYDDCSTPVPTLELLRRVDLLPDEVSKKSLKVLGRKLEWLAGLAKVLSACPRRDEFLARLRYYK